MKGNYYNKTAKNEIKISGNFWSNCEQYGVGWSSLTVLFIWKMKKYLIFCSLCFNLLKKNNWEGYWRRALAITVGLYRPLWQLFYPRCPLNNTNNTNTNITNTNVTNTNTNWLYRPLWQLFYTRRPSTIQK